MGEKSATMAFCSAGAYIGTALSLPLSSEVMTHFGWRSVYWGLGVLVVVWLVPFLLFVYETPEAYPGMTQEELDIIYTPFSPVSTSPGRENYELVRQPCSPRLAGAVVSNGSTSFLFTA